MDHYSLHTYDAPTHVSFDEEQLKVITHCFARETVPEIMQALVEIVNDPTDNQREWATRTYNRMKNSSPLSLMVTNEYFEMARHKPLTFFECLTMEYRLAQRFTKTKDYWEGINSIFERRPPKWEHPSIDKISQDMVDSFFEPMGDIRLELKIVKSRPNEPTPDYPALLAAYGEQHDVRLPAPEMMDEKDGGFYWSRMVPCEDRLTLKDKRKIPSITYIKRLMMELDSIVGKLLALREGLEPKVMRNKEYYEHTAPRALEKGSEILHAWILQIELPGQYRAAVKECIACMKPLLQTIRESDMVMDVYLPKLVGPIWEARRGFAILRAALVSPIDIIGAEMKEDILEQEGLQDLEEVDWHLL